MTTGKTPNARRPTKAAPRKATPKSAAKKAAAPATAPAAEPADDGTAEDQAQPATITFEGRTMAVQMPTPEQLAVWSRTAEKLTGRDFGDLSPEEGLKLYDRTQRIFGSVLADQVDRDWLEDQFLFEGLKLEKAGQIISLAVDALPRLQAQQEPTNRAARRAVRRK